MNIQWTPFLIAPLLFVYSNDAGAMALSRKEARQKNFVALRQAHFQEKSYVPGKLSIPACFAHEPRVASKMLACMVVLSVLTPCVAAAYQPQTVEGAICAKYVRTELEERCPSVRTGSAYDDWCKGRPGGAPLEESFLPCMLIDKHSVQAEWDEIMNFCLDAKEGSHDEALCRKRVKQDDSKELKFKQKYL